MTALSRIAFLEGLTLIALVCVAMPLKYWAGMPQAVSIIGPIHGVAFLVFLVFIMKSLSDGLITVFGAFRLFLGALIPFGGFVNERWLRHSSQLQV